MERLSRIRSTCFLLSLLMLPGLLKATPSSSLYSAVPPLLGRTAEPLVMLVMSVDHELFKKAYPDYSDLDGDGRLDTTYKDTIDYLGYFRSDWCYQYNSSSNRYTPVQQATGDNGHYCLQSTAPWSGNFLNWATMTRVDVLRRVLFGGKRSTDVTDTTVLERGYLPRDIHAFVKIYESNSTGLPASYFTPYSDSQISLCNVAASENGSPVVRVARGRYERWASDEVKQCQWGSGNSAPSSRKLAENTVRIEACVSGKGAETDTGCLKYPSGYYKPIGLLQRYGEDGSIRFGLLTGSYDKNISGGVLRRNISKIAGNASASEDEVNLGTGTFNSSINGIIRQINTFRIAKYSFSQNKYTDCSTYGISINTFKSGRSTWSNRHCSNWGNPLAEMYLEALRYFAGEGSATTAFNTSNDHQFVSNLTTENWVNPVSAANACANCSIILLSTGLNSFDTDELGSSSDIPGLSGTSTINSRTDEVGNLEYGGSFAGEYLVGGTGSTRQCTAKYLSGLSSARGLCPELPQLEGGYQVSGLAFHGNKTDLRSSLEGVQKVKTYAIQLAESIPSFTLNVGGKSVTFQPVCHTSSNFGSGSGNFSGSGSDCTLTDVVIENTVFDPDGNLVEGSLLFTWEDSLWGNDFDYDASSRIKFCAGGQCSTTSDSTLRVGSFGNDELRMAVQVDGVYAGLNLRFSYTITGTYDDGLKADFAYKGTSSYRVNNFTASGNAAGVLPKPLLLAAKYGGFSDLDGDGTPLHQSGDSREWDSRNNSTGALGADGLPDNYFFARNPALLAAQLGQILQDIASRVSSSTNTALFSNSHSGTGVLYQALFQPSMEFNGKSVSWGGLLHALFVDNKGFLREDSNGNDRLDDYATDRIVELIFDPNSDQTLLQRYATEDQGQSRSAYGVLEPLTSLRTIWDAREQLSALSDVTDQRAYSSPALSGRHILTWLDENNNGQVEVGETLPLTPSTFTGNEGYLGLDSSSVTTVVNYVRGEELPGTRSRTIDFDADGDDDVWRLGDIVHSTPRLVSSPDSRFDALYGDDSYASFGSHYQHRRHVVYVGANDGMIHAFNGGFWDEDSYAYDTTGSNSEVNHPLGSELWAYAPMNLLPHLQWLSEPDYPHVYYMDGEPLIFDANIFSPDSDHPEGWGTVLVMGMRFGGGPVEATIAGAARTMRSAYVVLDITNPEKPPKLLAEITHPELGFTTSKPTLVKRRQAGDGNDWSNPAVNEWYLAFGSGPAGAGEPGIREAIEQGKSNQSLKLFVYDLESLSFVSGLAPLQTTQTLSYAGDFTAVDWDSDYKDDAVYFGSVSTAGSSPGGSLLRLKVADGISASSLAVFLDSGKPIVASPLSLKDSDSHRIYVGTGRLQASVDNRDLTQQFFYGVREPSDNDNQLTYGSVSTADLVDTSAIEVLTSGTVRIKTAQGYEPFTLDSAEISSFSGLQAAMSAKSGWKHRLTYDGTSPSGRNINSASQLFSLILFTEFRPSADSCRVDGSSALLGLNYLTGTAMPAPVLGTRYVTSNLEEEVAELSESEISLGQGQASSPVIHQGEEGDRRAVTQGAGGSISSQKLDYQFSTSGRQSWRQIFRIPRAGME